MSKVTHVVSEFVSPIKISYIYSPNFPVLKNIFRGRSLATLTSASFLPAEVVVPARMAVAAAGDADAGGAGGGAAAHSEAHLGRYH